jgi:hypothetical protein
VIANPARWPRLLDRQDAAEYCGVSVNHFLAHCPVPPMTFGSKKLWDRHAIDAWLDGGHGGNVPTIEELLSRA